MATTKIWPVRGWLGQVVDYAMNPDKTGNTEHLPGSGKNDMDSLWDVMAYATRPSATEQKYYVSGINCVPEIARQQMTLTKMRYEKEGGIVAFHAYQSFLPGEVTPQKRTPLAMNWRVVCGAAALKSLLQRIWTKHISTAIL